MSAAPRTTVVRRGAYRVRPESLEELDLAVLEKKYKVIRGYVADVSCRGVQVQFRQNNVPALERDEPVLLAVASDRYDFDTTLRAKIVSSTDHEHGPLFRFAFEPGNEGLRTERSDLFNLFNRRAAYRRLERRRVPRAWVAPDDGAEGDPRQRVDVTVRNVSATGVNFTVAARSAHALASCEKLLLHIALPGRGSEDVIACHVRRCTEDGDEFGCEFDWSRTANAEACAARIVGYVVDRLAADQRVTPDRRYRRI